MHCRYVCLIMFNDNSNCDCSESAMPSYVTQESGYINGGEGGGSYKNLWVKICLLHGATVCIRTIIT